MILLNCIIFLSESVFNVPKNEIQVLGCKSWEDVSGEIFSGYSVFAIDEHAYVKRLFYRTWVNFYVRRLNVAMTVCDSYFRRALMADSLAYVAAAVLFIIGIKRLSSPKSAQSGNKIASIGMLVAIIATVASFELLDVPFKISG